MINPSIIPNDKHYASVTDACNVRFYDKNKALPIDLITRKHEIPSNNY